MASSDKTKIGIVGCGAISGIYLKNCTGTFDILEIAALCDLDAERARAAAEEYGVPKVCSYDEMLADPDIDIVLNLTIPSQHDSLNRQALEAGKHVHVEKPLALDREEAKQTVALAEEKNLRLGCAPDTFFGAGIQTCRKLIDDGWIGEPVAANAFMLCHGHESWHPAPEFYYKPGGGPMLDMGPYYVTAMVNLMGPVRRVSGSTGKSFDTRLITSEPLRGTVVDVEVPTHWAGTLDFHNGAIGTIITSFDVWASETPCIEIHGTRGSLSVPDPNTFGGPVRVKRAGAKEWSEVPLSHGFSENSRGIGVADIAHALRSGRPHRASGQLALHVLDIMQSIRESSEAGRHMELTTQCERPTALPMGLTATALDD